MSKFDNLKIKTASRKSPSILKTGNTW